MGAMVGAVPASFTTPWIVPPLETATTVYDCPTASCASSNVLPASTTVRGRRRGLAETFGRYDPAANSITFPPNAISNSLHRFSHSQWHSASRSKSSQWVDVPTNRLLRTRVDGFVGRPGRVLRIGRT